MKDSSRPSEQGPDNGWDPSNSTPPPGRALTVTRTAAFWFQAQDYTSRIGGPHLNQKSCGAGVGMAGVLIRRLHM